MDIMLRIAEIVFPLFAMVSVGVLYGWRFDPDMATASRINLHVFIPCLVFDAMVRHVPDPAGQGWLLLAALLMHGLPALLGAGVIAMTREAQRTVLPPVVFANAGNLGLPLMLLAFGEAALAPAVILFLVMNIALFTFGVRLLNPAANRLLVFRQPVLIAALLAVIVSLTGLTPAPLLMQPVQMLGQVAIPLMLFTLGVYLSQASLGAWRTGLFGGLLAPAAGLLSALLVVSLLPLDDLQRRVVLLFGALPPAVMTFIFAQRYNQEPDKVAAIVMIGNLLAVLVIPLTLVFVLP